MATIAGPTVQALPSGLVAASSAIAPSTVQGYFVPPTISQVPYVPRRFPGHFAPHRLCNHWNAHGWCKKAETCTFAHGLQELHQDVQTQLLNQPALAPVQVGKDGSVIVPGAAKGSGKGAVVATAPVLSTHVFTTPLTYTTAGFQAYTAPRLPFGFEFSNSVIPFQQDSAGLLPSTQEEDSDNQDDDHATGKKRPAPAPLTLDDSPQNASSAAVSLRPFTSPTAATYTNFARIPLASPMRITVVSRPLPSPCAGSILNPTKFPAASSVASAVPASSVTTGPLPSPTATVTMLRSVPAGAGTAAVAPVPMPLPSPARVTVFSGFRSATGAPWPGSPIMLSPTAVQSPTSPVPIDRSTFLQARSVAVMLEQGPPGLAQWAPTPTTKAGLLGFRYPQPGYMYAAPK